MKSFIFDTLIVTFITFGVGALVGLVIPSISISFFMALKVAIVCQLASKLVNFLKRA